MNKISIFVACVFLLSVNFIVAQTDEERSQIISNYNLPLLNQLEQEYDEKYQSEMAEALRLAAIYGWETEIKLPNGGIAVLVGILDDSTPKYYQTDNQGAGMTTRTDLVHTGGGAGLDLNGENMIGGIWDGGKVRATHILLSNRVTQIDNPSSLSDHSTHVSGTMIGTGNVLGGLAMGMAPLAKLHAYDFRNDESEMVAAASTGLLVSNHSYGLKIDNLPRWYLGYYDDNARNLDNIVYNAPYYLPVCSAGNDRQSGKNPGDGGYDYLTDKSVSKNSIVCAAVYQVLNYTGSTSVTMSNFSSWGPTDDGRIKPDISGKGVDTYSSTFNSNNSFGSKSGTSMATPNISGSLLLLQQHYNNMQGSFMLSSTLRGLALHTADEAGNYPGPDYRFGWGLLNTERAAEVITNNGYNSVIIEEQLGQDEVYTFSVKSDGVNDLVASITWTDPAGVSPPAGITDQAIPMLVNDLDIRVSNDGGVTFFPWKLNPAIPDAPATQGDNFVDNIEKIEISNASGEYIIRVSHKNILTNGVQPFSLIVTGIDREDFSVSTHQGIKEFCGSQNSVSYEIDLGFNDGFSDTINFSVANVPPGAIATLTPTTLSAPGTVLLTLNNLNNVAFGNYQVKVIASGNSGTINVYPILLLKDPQLPKVNLLAPLDTAVDRPINVVFNWDNAGVTTEKYDFQLSQDSNFSSFVAEMETQETQILVENLLYETEYFWRVKASNSCGEGDFSEVYSFTTKNVLGLDENSIEGLVVYPNPTNSVLNIQAAIHLESVEVINMLGQTLMVVPADDSHIQIETEGLGAGNYFLKITSDNKVTVKKFIKN